MIPDSTVAARLRHNFARAIIRMMRAVLISTYELGRQPFGLASPAAWLRRAGVDVSCFDLSRQAWNEAAVREADLVAFYVPMHTATRLAVHLIEPVQRLNPNAHICFYGLYAPVNETYLRGLGVDTILGGEFEEELAQLGCKLTIVPRRLEAGDTGPRLAGQESESKTIPRLQFIAPQRTALPPLKEYAHVVIPGGGHRVAGYTEASRGCKHLCRHCPIVPVYNGAFRIVQPEVVLADVRQQVAAGAEHITFGDPDFFNGPAHAMRVVEDLNCEFPQLTFDVTVKVEHLLKRADLLARLRAAGCLFVTSAVESVDDAILLRLDKGHTRADFLRVVELCRAAALPLQPTFVPFTPWTTLEGYADLLRVLADLELAESVAPIQLAIRLLIPAGSRLLELAEVREQVGPFDSAALAYPWQHADARVDALQKEVEAIVQGSEKLKRARSRTFTRIWDAAQAAIRSDGDNRPPQQMPILPSLATIPYLNEPWYC